MAGRADRAVLLHAARSASRRRRRRASPSTTACTPTASRRQVLVEWKAFLDLFVAHKIPGTSDLVQSLVAGAVQAGLPVVDRAPARRSGRATPAWRRRPPTGRPSRTCAPSSRAAPAWPAIPARPRAPSSTRWPSWPPPSAQPLRFYFHADGSLQPAPPTEASAASAFDLDPAAGERGILAPGGNVWDKLPAYDWNAAGAGQGGRLRDGAADRRHGDARHRQRRPVAALDRRRRRPRGQPHRGAARRPGDVRAVGLAPRVSCAARGRRDRAVAGADVRGEGRRAAGTGRSGRGARGDRRLPPRVPRRLADPHLRRHAGRTAARRGASRSRPSTRRWSRTPSATTPRIRRAWRCRSCPTRARPRRCRRVRRCAASRAATTRPTSIARRRNVLDAAVAGIASGAAAGSG